MAARYRRGNSVELACDGKRTYATWTAAAAVAKRMGRKGKSGGGSGVMAPYVCAFCHKFHVGSAGRS